MTAGEGFKNKSEHGSVMTAGEGFKNESEHCSGPYVA